MARAYNQMAEYRARLDHFAELLSLDIPLQDIGERMGLRRAAPYKMLSAIRRELGDQAR